MAYTNPLDPWFQFPLGAEVTHRGMVTPFRTPDGAPGERGLPQKLVVVERMLHECPGGIQRLYRVRAINVEMGEMSMAHAPNNAAIVIRALRTTSFVPPLMELNERELLPYTED